MCITIASRIQMFSLERPHWVMALAGKWLLRLAVEMSVHKNVASTLDVALLSNMQHFTLYARISSTMHVFPYPSHIPNRLWYVNKLSTIQNKNIFCFLSISIWSLLSLWVQTDDYPTHIPNIHLELCHYHFSYTWAYTNIQDVYTATHMSC